MGDLFNLDVWHRQQGTGALHFPTAEPITRCHAGDTAELTDEMPPPATGFSCKTRQVEALVERGIHQRDRLLDRAVSSRDVGNILRQLGDPRKDGDGIGLNAEPIGGIPGRWVFGDLAAELVEQVSEIRDDGIVRADVPDRAASGESQQFLIVGQQGAGQMHPVNRPRLGDIGAILVMGIRRAVEQVARPDLPALLVLPVVAFSPGAVNENPFGEVGALPRMAVCLGE